MAKVDYHERLKQIKEKHPRAYDKWDARENVKLRDSFLVAKKEGNIPTKIIGDMAKIFQRQPTAIRLALRKMGLVKS